MKVLITGSRGFVGHQFWKTLATEDDLVVEVDTACELPVDCRSIFRGDFCPNFDLVIHCAATIPAVDDRRSNRLTVAEDFALDAEMFQWALRTQPKQVVYFSSSAAYPTHLQTSPYLLKEEDIDLDHISNPDDMYGLTKLVGEVQAMEARRQGLNILIVRPQSGYGATQSANYPFRAMIERAKAREDPFMVWGTGDQVRDFVHINDVVGAVLTMCEEGFQGPVNIGSGVPISMVHLAHLVTAAAGYTPDIVTMPEKPIGTAYRCADTTLMDTIYKPTIGLEQGIRMALEA